MLSPNREAQVRCPLAQVLSIVLLVPACAPGLPDPVVSAVVPDWAYNGEDTDILIEGENFYPVVELDVREEGAHLDRQFEVELRGEEDSFSLEGVELIDYEQLAAEVPAGLPTGRYTVAVISPTEAVAHFPKNFTVTDTMAHHLAISTTEVYYTVNDPFEVELQLQDPYSVVLERTFPVVLTITSEEGPADFEVDESGLASAQVEAITDGYQIFGTLLDNSSRPDVVTITGHAEETLSFTLEASGAESEVIAAETRIGIIPGALSEIEVHLPGEPFSVEAGDPFEVELRPVDANGVLISDLEATVVLYETCGSYSTSLDILGATEVRDVAVTGATTEDCPENTLVAAGSAPGVSPGFEVLPAAAVGYDVEVYPNNVVAGQDTLYVGLTAVDEFGNTVTDYGEDWKESEGKQLGVFLHDEIGGIGEGYTDYQDCPGFEEGYQICWTVPRFSGLGNAVTAVGEDDLEGKSPAFNVHTGPLHHLLLVQDASPYAAGEPFTIEVQALDEPGNALITDPSSGYDVYEFEGSHGGIDCEASIATSMGWEFDCTATLAAEDQHLGVTLTVNSGKGTLSASAETDPFDVTNGTLAMASFDGPGGPQVAGEAFLFGLQTFDAYGNPYFVQASTPTVVDLADSTGSMDLTSIELDGNGEAESSATITFAIGDVVITASDSSSGAELGSTTSFDVEPAAAASFLVEPATPWAFLGEELEVTVTAQDAYGNTVTSYDQAVTISLEEGSGDAVSIDSFEAGTATASLDFDSAQLEETVVALSDDGELEGFSSTLDVLDLGCSFEAVLTVDGEYEPVICLASGSVTTTLDASGSSSSAAGFHFLDSAGNYLRTTSSSSSTVTWTEQAVMLVQLVAFDDQACGDHDLVVAWVAEPDGEPAGPVIVTPQDHVRVVGSSTDGATPIDVEAFDCAGDVAAYGTLLVRTSLGELDTALTESGQGLELVLDSKGTGQFDWTAEYEVHGGVSTVFVGRARSVALGTAAITVQGDDALPFVLDVEPVGESTETIDSISVRFSEALRSASVSTGNVTVSDSSGVIAISDLSLDSSQENLEITLADTVDLAGEVLELELSAQVRDEAGNRLDGGWQGSPASFVVTLGAVGSTAPDVTDCSVDTTTMRPDGDDSAGGDESDVVALTATTATTPDYWLLEVLDASREEVARYWLDTLLYKDIEWDARDQEGQLVDNGTYTLRVRAADASLNLGTSCEVDVVVDNIVVEVP